MENEIYEINYTTCALISKNNDTTIIFDNDGKKVVETPITKIINYNCIYYGSSYEGRISASRLALGSKYKLPIIVEESKEIIFFPTTSYNNKNCTWISLNNIETYEKIKDKVKITFKNKTTIELNLNFSSFENQVLRATKLLLNLKNRKNK